MDRPTHECGKAPGLARAENGVRPFLTIARCQKKDGCPFLAPQCARLQGLSSPRVLGLESAQRLGRIFATMASRRVSPWSGCRFELVRIQTTLRNPDSAARSSVSIASSLRARSIDKPARSTGRSDVNGVAPRATA